MPAERLRGINRNQYFRFQTLSRKLTERADNFRADQGRGAEFTAINTNFNQRLEGDLNVAECANAMPVVRTKHPWAPTSG